jgi:hypothetical protein
MPMHNITAVIRRSHVLLVIVHTVQYYSVEFQRPRAPSDRANSHSLSKVWPFEPETKGAFSKQLESTM